MPVCWLPHFANLPSSGRCFAVFLRSVRSLASRAHVPTELTRTRHVLVARHEAIASYLYFGAVLTEHLNDVPMYAFRHCNDAVYTPPVALTATF
jgi:hypothetical protein